MMNIGDAVPNFNHPPSCQHLGIHRGPHMPPQGTVLVLLVKLMHAIALPSSLRVIWSLLLGLHHFLQAQSSHLYLVWRDPNRRSSAPVFKWWSPIGTSPPLHRSAISAFHIQPICLRPPSSQTPLFSGPPWFPVCPIASWPFSSIGWHPPPSTLMNMNKKLVRSQMCVICNLQLTAVLYLQMASISGSMSIAIERSSVTRAFRSLILFSAHSWKGLPTSVKMTLIIYDRGSLSLSLSVIGSASIALPFSCCSAHSRISCTLSPSYCGRVNI